MIVVLAEKPSVAVDIAKVVGARRRHEGYYEGGGYQVTWALGHLVDWAFPGAYRPDWKAWRTDSLPMLPDPWKLAPRKAAAQQLSVVKRLLRAREVKALVAATDAGREGELIWRLIVEYCGGCRSKKLLRLWISSLTPESIRAGFGNLKPARQYDSLAAAARVRAQADWLVGLNLTRAYSLAHSGRGVISVGRVQTPTLAMIVARDLQVEGFRSLPYLELVVRFTTAQGDLEAKYVRRGCDELTGGKFEDTTRLPVGTPEDPESDVEAVKLRLAASSVEVATVQRTSLVSQPPLLFDLTELQRVCNRAFGWSANRTLQLAQSLYERHKLLSYPRTDSRYLTRAVASELPSVLLALRTQYPVAAALEGKPSLPSRFVQDSRVADHHAVIPTSRSAEGLPPGSDERALYDLVVRRLLCAYLDDYVEDVTAVTLRASHSSGTDRYVASGHSVVQEGWRALVPRSSEESEAPRLPPGLRPSMAASVGDLEVRSSRTRPPPRLTDALLLTAMETAGKTLDDRALSVAMSERGLGTPATRAATLEGLIARGFVRREGRSLVSTAEGREVVRRVRPAVRSPQLTGEWELRLKHIEAGQESAEVFLRDVERAVTKAVGEALGTAAGVPGPCTGKVGRPTAPAGGSKDDGGG